MKLFAWGLFCLTLTLVSCDNSEVTQEETNTKEKVFKAKTNPSADSQKVKLPQRDSIPSSSQSAESEQQKALQKFLKMPLDFPAFKKVKGGSNSGSGGSKIPLYQPDTTGFYYRYLLFPPSKGQRERPSMEGLVVTVFYYGTEVGYWNLNNEELVGISCMKRDSDLGEADLIARDTSSLLNQWGVPQYKENGHWVYSHKNGLLHLKLKGKIVRHWKYYRLQKGIDWKKYWPQIRDQQRL